MNIFSDSVLHGSGSSNSASSSDRLLSRGITGPFGFVDIHLWKWDEHPSPSRLMKNLPRQLCPAAGASVAA